MLKFIKMKQHEGYLLYYSVLFVVIVVLTVIQNCSANWSPRLKKIENSLGLHFLRVKLQTATLQRVKDSHWLVNTDFPPQVNHLNSLPTIASLFGIDSTWKRLGFTYESVLYREIRQFKADIENIPWTHVGMEFLLECLTR